MMTEVMSPKLSTPDVNVTTTTMAADVIWVMPDPIWASGLVLTALELALSLFANTLLIATICYSPSLKTPPNIQLVSICCNNLLLCLSMLFSLVNLLAGSKDVSTWFHPANKVLGLLQLFIITTGVIQFCFIFAAIGFYRSRTLKKPSMSLSSRKKIVRRSVFLGWTTSLAVGVALTSSFKNTLSTFTWNSFASHLRHSDIDGILSPNIQQTVILVMACFAFIVGFGIIVISYYRIFLSLYSAKPIWRNKIAPWNRASSLSSDDNDLTMSTRRYMPSSEQQSRGRSPFTISGSATVDNFVVHFQKRSHSLSLEIYAALEHPTSVQHTTMFKATSRHPKLQPQLSNASNTSCKSKFADFTDISPSGEVERLERQKNKCALRNQTLRKDRISLSYATKNSIVMILTYVTCSLPMVLFAIPGVLNVESPADLSVPQMFSRIVFYLNAPAYPLWYLIFSRRVRKCLGRMSEHWMIRLHLKR